MRIAPLPLAALLLFAFAAGAAGQDAAQKDEPAKPSQEELEKAFAQRLTKSQLVGHYTLWGREDKPSRDTYTIESVTKQDGDYWLFVARIQYGKYDLKLPLRLQVKWAGDTPVITLDKLPVPGLGTFSARVVFQGDQYAAVWDGGDHGGHMYGKIVKQKDADDGEEEPKK